MLLKVPLIGALVVLGILQLSTSRADPAASRRHHARGLALYREALQQKDYPPEDSLEEAIRAFNEALAEDAANLQANFDLALALAQSKQLDGAAEALGRVLLHGARRFSARMGREPGLDPLRQSGRLADILKNGPLTTGTRAALLKALGSPTAKETCRSIKIDQQRFFIVDRNPGPIVVYAHQYEFADLPADLVSVLLSPTGATAGLLHTLPVVEHGLPAHQYLFEDLDACYRGFLLFRFGGNGMGHKTFVYHAAIGGPEMHLVWTLARQLEFFNGDDEGSRWDDERWLNLTLIEGQDQPWPEMVLSHEFHQGCRFGVSRTTVWGWAGKRLRADARSRRALESRVAQLRRRLLQGDSSVALDLTRLVPRDKAARLALIKGLIAKPNAGLPGGVPAREDELAIHLSWYASQATRAERRALKSLLAQAGLDPDELISTENPERQSGCVGVEVQRVKVP